MKSDDLEYQIYKKMLIKKMLYRNISDQMLSEFRFKGSIPTFIDLLLFQEAVQNRVDAINKQAYFLSHIPNQITFDFERRYR